jgi:AcrR family transcriptional regulator
LEDDAMYPAGVPKLWNQTIEAHRREVREAILVAAGVLVAEHGLLSVTMSQIAEQTGIGRATLYKYFPDVEAILNAWHERHVTGHLARLAQLRNQDGGPGEQLETVLEAYAGICHNRGRHGVQELGALLHRSDQVVKAEQQLHKLFRDLLAEVAASGDIRDDIPPGELANYCMHALSAASSLGSEDAVHRLVVVTLAGLVTSKLDVALTQDLPN